MPGKQNEHLTIRQAAEYLGAVPNTVRAWGDSDKASMYWNAKNGYGLLQAGSSTISTVAVSATIRKTILSNTFALPLGGRGTPVTTPSPPPRVI